MKNKQVIVTRIKFDQTNYRWKVYAKNNFFVGYFFNKKDVENFYNIFLSKRNKLSFLKQNDLEGLLILSPDKKSVIRLNYSLIDDKDVGDIRIVDLVFSRKLIEETLILAKMMGKET